MSFVTQIASGSKKKRLGKNLKIKVNFRRAEFWESENQTSRTNSLPKRKLSGVVWEVKMKMLRFSKGSLKRTT